MFHWGHDFRHGDLPITKRNQPDGLNARPAGYCQPEMRSMRKKSRGEEVQYPIRGVVPKLICINVRVGGWVRAWAWAWVWVHQWHGLFGKVRSCCLQQGAYKYGGCCGYCALRTCVHACALVFLHSCLWGIVNATGFTGCRQEGGSHKNTPRSREPCQVHNQYAHVHMLVHVQGTHKWF